MKKILLSVMSGALVCLSLVFASCGNIDNPLEEMGNSPLRNLKDGDVITINTEILAGLKAGSMAFKFTKTGSTFELDKDAFREAMMSMSGGEFENEKQFEKMLAIFADACSMKQENNLLKFEFVLNGNIIKTRNSDETGEKTIPALVVTFDLSTSKYAQYPYMMEGCFIFKDIEINGVKQNIPTDFDKEAVLYTNRNPYATTRSEASAEQYKLLVVFYKEGETWAAVNKRYDELAGYPLFGEENGYAMLGFAGEWKIPFAYFGNYTGVPEILSNLVKPNDKVGYKADGKTANPEGYLIPISEIE